MKYQISQKFEKIYNKIIQRQLQTRMIQKCIKKEIYPQKEDKKLLLIWDPDISPEGRQKIIINLRSITIVE